MQFWSLDRGAGVNHSSVLSCFFVSGSGLSDWALAHSKVAELGNTVTVKYDVSYQTSKKRGKP